MKDDNLLFIGVISLAIIAGSLFAIFSDEILLPDKSMTNKTESLSSVSVRPTEEIVTVEKEKINPTPVSIKQVKNDDSMTLSAAAEEEPIEDISEKNAHGMADPANDKNIVDKALLRQKFPDKIDLIPVTDEEIEDRKQVVKEGYERFGKILANKATEDEINLYYDDKLKVTKDRIEILEYAITEFGDKLSEDGARRQTNTMMILESQLSKIPERRERAIARLRKSGTP